MSFKDNLRKLKLRHNEIETRLSTDKELDSQILSELGKELSGLGPIVEKINNLDKIFSSIEETNIIISENTGDKEMKDLAESELSDLLENYKFVENELKIMLIPKDENDSRNAMLEVRAGTGGEEAALFAADLFKMYEKYSISKGWGFEIIDINEIGIGGFKEAVASISGIDVFGRLKFESGVHRVQRVPSTESSGRVHTSAATVAILPEAEEVDVNIDTKDLRVDTYRAQGAGGQHVNKTDSAVRITHLPTNIVVQCQDQKSQHKNRLKAMKVLRARLYDQIKDESDRERAENRKDQVGSGDRSQRIRTYNFPQGRITDHRINLTVHKLEEMLEGEALDDLVDALAAEERAEKLASLTN
ncbi:MAG: peptide chain release factor 1 [Alphaproteobacteria bacterium TMED87]|nr:peptide chain release factor 1 [Rhodospirillaceae bacterium]OUV11350.1 MAG: peptide chain release factor 1 [Alphaproteobacteria bacterium TMED87]